MSGHELFKAISEETGIAQEDIHTILRAASDVIYEKLSNDRNERITFGNLGFFKVKHINEHKTVSNLQKFRGKEFTVPEHDEIEFIPFRTHRDLEEQTGD